MPTPSPAPRAHGRRDAASDSGTTDLREAILAATARLLAGRSFADLAVSDILTAAGVSRGTFYFYFDSKQAVLAELVRRAVAQVYEAAEPWRAGPGGSDRAAGPAGRAGGTGRADPADALRSGLAAGARLWQASAPVLRAIVENWHTDPRLTALWLEQMRGLTDASVARITTDPRATETLAGHDIGAVASALTWLGERLFYLAATGTPPFDDDDTLTDTLAYIWAAVLYRPTGYDDRGSTK
jgi:TetR/AcrR family transcriptional regulator, ethionamide resistance regulator